MRWGDSHKSNISVYDVLNSVHGESGPCFRRKRFPPQNSLLGYSEFFNKIARYAIAAQVLFAIVIILASSLRGLLSYLGLTLSLCAACSVACLFLPSVRRKPFLHLSHLPPLIYVTCTLAAAVIMTTNNPTHLIGTVLTVAVGALVYAVVPRKRSSKTNSPPKTHSRQA